MAYTQKVITDNDKSPLIQVLSLFFLVFSILSCLVRTLTKLYMVNKLRLDDILVIIATLFAVGQTVAIYRASEYGLGQHIADLASDNVQRIYKAQYASNTMFIVLLVLCKISATMTLRTMTQRNQKRVILACEAIIGVWGLSSLIVNFFQCALPTPWDYSDRTKCISLAGFWTFFSIVNIITDLGLIVIMAGNVLKIQTSLSKKVLVLAVFGSRILVTPAIAVQIYYSNKSFSGTDDTFAWEAALAIVMVQWLAIFTVCVPNLKPFLDSLESGQNRLDDQRRQGKSSSNGYPTNRPGYRNYKSPQNSSINNSQNRPPRPYETEQKTNNSDLSYVHEMADFSQSKRGGAGGKGTTTPDEHGPTWDGQSRTSHSSQTILIHQTWQVDVEGASQVERRGHEAHAM